MFVNHFENIYNCLFINNKRKHHSGGNPLLNFLMRNKVTLFHKSKEAKEKKSKKPGK